jgi:hypothetical protein
LVLALAVKKARHPSISVARRAIASRWSAGIALVLPPQEQLSDGD